MSTEWEWSTVTRPNGVADVMELPPAPNASLNLVLYFIPGNPGLVSYYPLFLRTCQDELRSAGLSAHVVALGHLEHRCPPSNALSKGKGKSKEMLEESYPPVGLQAQQEHHSLFTSSLTARFPGTPIVLVAHSLGTYLALQLLPLHPSVSSAILLFPALSRLASSRNGRRHKRLLRHIYRPLIGASRLLSTLSAQTVLSLVQTLVGHTGESAKVTASFVAKPSSVANGLHLISDALKQMSDPPLKLLERHAHKLDLYYTAPSKDHWVPERAAQEIERAVAAGVAQGATLTRCKEGMMHAFSLKEENARILAKKVAGWIQVRRKARDTANQTMEARARETTGC